MVEQNHPKTELTPSQVEEMELFRQILQDERDYYDRFKYNEPQNPNK